MPVPTDAAAGTLVSQMQAVLQGANNVSSGGIQPLSLDAPTADARPYAGNGSQGLIGAALGYTFNESTFDRLRGNTAAASHALGSAARTASSGSGTQTNYNARGIKVVLDITAASGTGGLTLNIQLADSTSGKSVTLLTGVNITTTGTFVYTVYPGIAAVANVSANDVLPRSWKFNVVAGDGSSYTYSVAAFLIV